MKQLYYTSCKEGKSVSGRSGFEVRAHSAGIDPAVLVAAIRYAGYVVDPELLTDQDFTSEKSLRLACLQTPELGRIICHSLYLGTDETTGRQGNFFSHLLLDLPDSVSPADAIRCWGQDFWQTRDGDFALELAEVDKLPNGSASMEAQFFECLRDPAFRDVFGWFLHAFVSTQGQKQIVIAAASNLVAH
ncbi:MAG: hypothetical protein MI861_07900, partial [Pirellulales bacterium]|nr:hypothetical protein [Pirellulales bacterium]